MSSDTDDFSEKPNLQPGIEPRFHIGFLDGIRGILSLWVFIGHAALLAGYNTILIPPALIAVDIFMMVSGFLMAYTLFIRNNGDYNLAPGMIIPFYIRRVCRIVPVYYLLLLIVVVFSTSFIKFESEATAIFPPLWAASEGNDPSIRSITFFNIILHLTFLFGLNPHYAANMPIPDWSLTLEMQFYAIVPFLLVAFKKYGLIIPIAGLIIVNFLALAFIGIYLTPKIGGLWPQPSFLIFKIDCFVSGILLAFYFIDKNFNKSEILCLLIIILALEKTVIFSLVIVLCFAILAIDRSTTGIFTSAARFCANFLQGKLMKFFGDISFDLYLIHPLVLLTLVHFFLTSDGYIGFAAPIRFILLFGAAAIITVPISYLIHLAIERPCQKAAGPISAWALARLDGGKLEAPS